MEPCIFSCQEFPPSPNTPLQNQHEKKKQQSIDHEEEDITISKVDVSLFDLNVSTNHDFVLDCNNNNNNNNNQEQGSPELNLITSLDVANDSSLENNNINNLVEVEQRVFSCNYCHRKFYSSQALGGHQNAHKRERSIAKRGQRFGTQIIASASSFGFPVMHNKQSYANMASLPLYGALGIQAHSMIQKPSHVSSNGFGSSYGHHHHHHGWSTSPSALSSSRGSVGRFEVVDTMKNSAANKEISGYFVSGGTSLKTHMNQEEMKQKHLDLSLKL